MNHRSRSPLARLLALCVFASTLTVGGASATRQIAEGPFSPNWASLQNYQCPDWFRDAKFGIWAHWSAQCVPEQGDWYAQRMYLEGSADYRYQVANYGHAARAWDWLQVAFGADKTGPLAGVPYDGHLTKADGKGTWWEGFDPADLYVRPYAKGETRDPAYLDKFFNRIKELEDRYKPELLYFDDRELPLGEVGLNLAANLYNASANRNGGTTQAVINGKYLPEGKNHSLVEDFERGYGEGLKSLPWQTCTCIGDWHYKRGLKYKSVGKVVRTLVDVVSKNGNLLLSIPLRADGSIDDDELAFLAGMERWMKINSVAIFGTRPWVVYGEGPTHTGGARFNEEQIVFGEKDIRFTTKGDLLYAFVLGWPAERKVDIDALADNGASSRLNKTVSQVTLLGATQPLKWQRDALGLHVTLPEQAPCDEAIALQIETTAR